MARGNFQSQDTEANYYVKHLGRFGLSKESFQQHKTPYDVAWNFCNETIINLSAKKDWQTLSQLYYAMAIISDETNRRSPIELLKQSSYWQLIDHQLHFPEGRVTISATSESCDACKSQNGKSYSLREALVQLPIPHTDCSYQLFNYSGFCRCQYLFDPLGDSIESKTTVSQPNLPSKPKQMSRKTINTILIAIPTLCILCVACNWILQTFFPVTP